MIDVVLRAHDTAASADCNALQVWSKVHLTIFHLLLYIVRQKNSHLLYSKNIDDKDIGWI